jgi:peptide/nickel transport system permease protein
MYAIPILIGVNVSVFVLFFLISTPDDMARAHLGSKRSTPERMDEWKREHQLHLPMFYNNGWTTLDSVYGNEPSNDREVALTQPGRYRLVLEGPTQDLTQSINLKADGTNRLRFSPEFKSGTVTLSAHNAGTPKPFRGPWLFEVVGASTEESLTVKMTFNTGKRRPRHRVHIQFKKDLSLAGSLTETIFYRRSVNMLFFDFGRNQRGEDIGQEIGLRLAPTLAITIPALLLGSFLNILIAMTLAFCRGTYADYWGSVICVLSMSISALFYIIGGQWFFGSVLKLVPVSGFDIDTYSPRFWIMPVAIIVMAGMGATTRFYRTIFLEEINRDYVRTARAKGTPERAVLFVHTLKNAMIPILTGLVTQLPMLFLGSLLIEKFFSIPGMGAYMVESIQAQDFTTVQAMVSIGSFVYVIGLLLTDISYTLVDPRVRLDD